MNVETLETIDLGTLEAVTGGGKLWRKIKRKLKKAGKKVLDWLETAEGPDDGDDDGGGDE